MRELVFIHGRSQQDKDAAELKASWIEAFKSGLAKNDLELPIGEDQIRFPYYGNTLRDLVEEIEDVAEVIVKGEGNDAEKQAFIRELILEIQTELEIDEQELRQAAGQEVIEKGPLEWEWLQTVLRVIDRRIPGASGETVALFTEDVYNYIHEAATQIVIDNGVKQAFRSGVEQVVVSHSLGTVVAYHLLKKESQANGWKVPLLVTLGSPLGIEVIKNALAPLGHPAGVGEWFNAFDQRDIVALYALDKEHFNILPAITNYGAVDNHTSNRHGISGYLDDPVVAKTIYDALESRET